MSKTIKWMNQEKNKINNAQTHKIINEKYYQFISLLYLYELSLQTTDIC